MELLAVVPYIIPETPFHAVLSYLRGDNVQKHGFCMTITLSSLTDRLDGE